MARFSVTVRPCRPTHRPHLKWGVNAYHPTRGRSRTYFKTKEEAEAEKASAELQAERFGTQAPDLTAAQRIAALDAFEKLQPFSVTLTAVVNDYVDRRRSSTATVAEVSAMYLKSRERLGRSSRHLDGLRGLPNDVQLRRSGAAGSNSPVLVVILTSSMRNRVPFLTCLMNLA